MTTTLPPVEPFTASYLVAVVDDDPRIRSRLVSRLDPAQPAASFDSLSEFDAQTEAGSAVVIVLGPSFADSANLADVNKLLRGRSELTAVMVVDELTTEFLQQAIRSGVSDVITVPAELSDAVERAAENISVAPASPVTPGGIEEDGGVRGRLITVFSTKGGSGKSVIACNLGVVLARRTERPVVLVDADLQFGDVAVMLKLTPQNTIVDAVSSIHRMDAALLKSLLIRHERSGLYVLPAPTEPAFADQVTPAALVQILQLLRTFCAYIVVDTPAHFTDVVLSILDESDDVVLVAGMDIPSIKNVKIGLQTLRLLDMSADKLKLVLNRANAKVKLDVSEVERTLQLKADSLIPSDIVMPRSVNKGVPAVLDEPKSSVARSMEQLADLFLVESKPQRRGR